jgi:hypothetical protein
MVNLIVCCSGCSIVLRSRSCGCRNCRICTGAHRIVGISNRGTAHKMESSMIMHSRGILDCWVGVPRDIFDPYFVPAFVLI